jgi:hypothetical protein
MDADQDHRDLLLRQSREKRFARRRSVLARANCQEQIVASFREFTPLRESTASSVCPNHPNSGRVATLMTTA